MLSKLTLNRMVFGWMILAIPCFAANRYVRPGATGGTGNDWGSAYGSLPASLVRGDTYYLASGSYGSYTFDDANSGSTVITIRKATAADHGTNTGWSDSYGTGQASFSRWNVYTDYYTFDGAVRNPDWYKGAVDAYGIRVSGGAPVRLDNGSGTGGDNLTFRYVDIRGGGRDTGSGDDVIYGLSGNSNITFQYCALHDSDRTIFLMRGNWQNLKVDRSYLARNTSSPATHGEILSSTTSTNVVFSNNIIEDPEGTAVWAMLNGGTATNWDIVGNVIFHSEAYRADTGRAAGHNKGIAATVYCAHDASNSNTCNNVHAYNNTLYHLQGVYSGFRIESGTGGIAQNNIWHSNSGTTSNLNMAEGWNWYFSSPTSDSTSTKITCSTNCDIFKDAAGEDFRLKAATAPGSTLSGLTALLGLDLDGIVRGADGTWDRGAYEFSSTVSSGPPIPTGLVAIGH